MDREQKPFSPLRNLQLHSSPSHLYSTVIYWSMRPLYYRLQLPWKTYNGFTRSVYWSLSLSVSQASWFCPPKFEIRPCWNMWTGQTSGNWLSLALFVFLDHFPFSFFFWVNKFMNFQLEGEVILWHLNWRWLICWLLSKLINLVHKMTQTLSLKAFSILTSMTLYLMS